MNNIPLCLLLIAFFSCNFSLIQASSDDIVKSFEFEPLGFLQDQDEESVDNDDSAKVFASFFPEMPKDYLLGSCFFVNSTDYDVWDFHGIEDTQLETSTGILHFNFCENSKTKCGDTPSQLVFIPTDSSKPCKNFAGKAEDFNGLALVGSTTKEGVKYYMNQSPSKLTVTWVMSCPEEDMESGKIVPSPEIKTLDPSSYSENEELILKVTTKSGMF